MTELAESAELRAALSLDFVRNALIVGALTSVLCGVVGVFVVVKRLTFISDGIGHAAFAGLGLCYLLGADPRLGAIAVAVAFALLLGAAGTDAVRRHDSLIGVFYAAGMALGILFIHQSPGYAPNLMSYLFGNILLADRTDVVVTLGLSTVVLGVVAVFFQSFLAVTFDEVFAFVQGVPVRLVFTLLLVLVSLSVVLLIQVVGIILVLALLTIPPLTALALARDLSGVLALSVLVGLAMTLGGLALSFHLDQPSGPVIILLGAAALVLARLAQSLRRRRARR
jgi:zinc transport system permease protein